MRFLQTEWHRHERERNAWEIERQEMKARIASLEGAGRRSDVSQLTLKKYISMLELTLKQERRKPSGTVEESADKSKSKDLQPIKGNHRRKRCRLHEQRDRGSNSVQLRIYHTIHSSISRKTRQSQKPSTWKPYPTSPTYSTT